MILGSDNDPDEDDALYCIDLGLVKKGKHGLEIANSIYREIVPRVLTSILQDNMLHIFIKPDWLMGDGRLSIHTMLTMFNTFWHENEAIIPPKAWSVMCKQFPSWCYRLFCKE